MATQTINYLHQIDQIDEPVAEKKIVDRVPQLIRDNLIGYSRWAAEARRLVAAHAAHDDTVIFEGEPGGGKHFLATPDHQCSLYLESPFVFVVLGSSTN